MGVTALVLVQIGWATPLRFRQRTGTPIAPDPRGMEGRGREQLEDYRSEYVALGNALPKNAVVMLHNLHGSWGSTAR